MKEESDLSDLRKFMTAAVTFWQTLGLELKKVLREERSLKPQCARA